MRSRFTSVLEPGRAVLKPGPESGDGMIAGASKVEPNRVNGRNG